MVCDKRIEQLHTKRHGSVWSHYSVFTVFLWPTLNHYKITMLCTWNRIVGWYNINVSLSFPVIVLCGYNDDISALLYYNKDPSFFDAHNICKCHYTTFVKFRFNQISKYSETSL